MTVTRGAAIRQGMWATGLALTVCFVFLSASVRLEVARAAIPPAQSGYAIVAVKVGGDRGGPSTVGPLKGARFGLFTNLPTSYDPFTGFTTAGPVNNTWAICTSDADGDCVFTVRIGAVGQGGVPSNTRLWVAPIDPPDANWFESPVWETAPLAGTSTNQTRHVFQTPQLQSGGRYISGSRGSSPTLGPRHHRAALLLITHAGPRRAGCGRCPDAIRRFPRNAVSRSRWWSICRAP